MTNVDILRSNGVNIESSLEFLGDMEMYNETLEDFLTEMEDRLPNLEKYKNNSDLSNYAILVHALKSDSKYLGFEVLAELALNHELRAKENDLDFINNNYEELLIEMNRIIDLATNYLGNN